MRHSWTITARQMSTDFLPIHLRVHSWAGLSCQWLSFIPFMLHPITNKKEFKKNLNTLIEKPSHWWKLECFWHIVVFFQKLPSLRTSFQMPYVNCEEHICESNATHLLGATERFSRLSVYYCVIYSFQSFKRGNSHNDTNWDDMVVSIKRVWWLFKFLKCSA